MREGDLMKSKAMLLKLLLVLCLTVQVGCTHSGQHSQPSPIPIIIHTTPTVSQNTPANPEIQIIESTHLAQTPLNNSDIISTATPSGISFTPPDAEFIDGKMIILAAWPWGPFYIEDILTGKGRILNSDVPIRIQEWGDNGCTLIVFRDNDIVETDLHGNPIRILFRGDEIPASHGAISFTTISPDRDWVYYLVGTGVYNDCGDDTECFYEYNDLETISVNGEQGPYRLSQGGGAWRVAWSPDGQHLAFSDYDEFGNQQLFLGSRDGSNHQQLTHLNTDQVLIMGIKWSPDGRRISAVVDKTGDQAADMTVIVELNTLSSLELVNVGALWWRDHDSLVAWRRIQEEPISYSIVVLDVTTNWVTTAFSVGCRLVSPFGNPTMVGCITIDDEFWVYNSTTNSIEQYTQFDRFLDDLYYWRAAPESFPGESNCGISP
jgi:hypothetical protein